MIDERTGLRRWLLEERQDGAFLLEECFNAPPLSLILKGQYGL
jgi:hypothetical protein